MDISALNIARYILYIAYTRGDCVTNLKIQKLLYYAQAWHLVKFAKPLFSNEIRALQHGPVVPEVYDKYKIFADKPIEDNEANGKKINLLDSEKEYLEDICGYFSKHSATDLFSMIQSEAPWINAYKKGPGSVISLEELRDYYSNINPNKISPFA